MKREHQNPTAAGPAEHGETPWSESTGHLLEQARSGNEESLEVLYRRYLQPLQRWATGRLPHWARELLDTQDLIQDTLVKSLDKIDQFEYRHEGGFHAYLRRGVLNRMRDEIRRISRNASVKDSVGDLMDPGDSPLEAVIGLEAVDRYEQALQSIDPDDREAILARVELGFSFQQVAAILGKPSADAARMAVNRALVRLAKKMADAE